MLRKHGHKGVALVLAALLGGCSSLFDSRDWTFADSGSGGMFRAAWGGKRRDAPGTEPSTTIQRLRGVETTQEPLQIEPGNVWPAEEAPRATLANPDAALRGVPPYRPGETSSGADLQSEAARRGPALSSDATSPPVEEQGPRGQRRRRASSPPPPPLEQPAPDRLSVLPVPPGANAPPPLRADGQPVLTPNGPVVTSGGNNRVQSFTTPGGGTGIIERNGGFTTVTPSGGLPQTFPNPR